MSIYTSRYSNPELRKGIYTAVRISLGTPKWSIGYPLTGELKDLMPFGLLNKYELYEDFKREYFMRLDRIGVSRIRSQLQQYEDIRKGPENWCHRTAFAEWWLLKTGEAIKELYDPTPDPTAQKPKVATSSNIVKSEEVSPFIQMSLF